MRTYRCLDCDDTTERMSSASDAEWHNTATGHDVTITYEDGVTYRLTDEGWLQALLPFPA